MTVRKVAECGRRSALCLITTTQANIKLTCPNGESNDYADPDAVVPRSGYIRESSTSSDGTVETTVIHVKHNGTITGTLEVAKAPDSIDPEEVTGYCSGQATFLLKRA